MLERLKNWWHRTTTNPCENCEEPVKVTAYRKTGRTETGTWWAGGGVELECPNCGHTFWIKQ